MIAALLSLVRRRRRHRLLGEQPVKVVPGQIPDGLADISVEDFKRLVGEAFRGEGFLVVERAAAHPARDVDLELFLGRERYLVQCHRWMEATVDAWAVRELYAAITTERAAGGFIVTSGKLSDEARKIVLGRSIRLVPADSLLGLLNAAKPSGAGNMTISPPFSPAKQERVPPACPRCGKVMMPRMHRQGGSVSLGGWGCTGFPACQGRREA